MIKPALPANEAERLAALQRYRILDTPREQAFDDLVTIARAICGTSMGAVSLIDDERQWFKSLQGMEGEQTPREEAFCAHAILQPADLTVVEDALQDARFRGNPLVTDDPFIRFYAGAPLLSSDGYALGTLCVFDSHPAQLAGPQAAALQALSRQVSRLLEMRRLRRRIDPHQSEHDWYEARLAEYYVQLEQQNLELSEQTRTDPLTGLPNRRALSAALAEAIARDAGVPPAVAIGLPVTISIGLATQHPGESAQDMLRRADAALYQAKAQGRDRVVVAG